MQESNVNDAEIGQNIKSSKTVIAFRINVLFPQNISHDGDLAFKSIPKKYQR